MSLFDETINLVTRKLILGEQSGVAAPAAKQVTYPQAAPAPSVQPQQQQQNQAQPQQQGQPQQQNQPQQQKQPAGPDLNAAFKSIQYQNPQAAVNALNTIHKGANNPHFNTFWSNVAYDPVKGFMYNPNTQQQQPVR